MSIFGGNSGGSGGGSGLTPEQYAGLTQDEQLQAVRNELMTEIPSLITSRTQECINRTLASQAVLEQAIAAVAAASAMPSGFVAEFPANAVPAGWEVIQGNPTELPTGFGTAGVSRTTGSGTTQRGFARTLSTNRIWSLYGTTLAALDLTTNRYDATTYTLPVNPGTGYRSAVLHDLSDSRVLATIGNNGSLGDARAYTFDAASKVFTQVANFQLTGTDGQARSGNGGSTLRLADGRLFWLPSETWRTTSAATQHANLGATNGGYYFLYNPATNTVTSHRFSNWAAALATGDIAESGSGGTSGGLHASLPLAQLPDGRILLQELASNITASRYFFLDLTANTITQGTGSWVGGSWALAAHPQGVVAFTNGSTARRYYNAATNTMDAANAASYSTVTVSAANTGFGYKALPFGTGNYALPANTGSADTMALAFDTFTRLGTVRARKI